MPPDTVSGTTPAVRTPRAVRPPAAARTSAVPRRAPAPSAPPLAAAPPSAPVLPSAAQRPAASALAPYRALHATPEHAPFLASLPLFAALPPRVIDAIARQARCVRLARQAVLFERGAPATGFWVMVSGRVQLVLPAEGGGDKVLASFGAGTPFGEAAMFAELPYPVECRAVDDSQVLFVPAAAVLPALHRSGELAQRFLRDLGQRMHGLIDDIAQYTQKSAESRVAALLLQLAREDDAADTVRLPERKRAIASRLSVAPETLSRMLRAFQDDGLIQVDGYRVRLLDPARLARIAQAAPGSAPLVAPCAAARRAAAHGPARGDLTTDGQAMDSLAVDGLATDGLATDGPVVDGPATDGAAAGLTPAAAS